MVLEIKLYFHLERMQAVAGGEEESGSPPGWDGRGLQQAGPCVASPFLSKKINRIQSERVNKASKLCNYSSVQELIRHLPLQEGALRSSGSSWVCWRGRATFSILGLGQTG